MSQLFLQTLKKEKNKRFELPNRCNSPAYFDAIETILLREVDVDGTFTGWESGRNSSTLDFTLVDHLNKLKQTETPTEKKEVVLEKCKKLNLNETKLPKKLSPKKEIKIFLPKTPRTPKSESARSSIKSVYSELNKKPKNKIVVPRKIHTSTSCKRPTKVTSKVKTKVAAKVAIHNVKPIGAVIPTKKKASIKVKRKKVKKRRRISETEKENKKQSVSPKLFIPEIPEVRQKELKRKRISLFNRHKKAIQSKLPQIPQDYSQEERKEKLFERVVRPLQNTFCVPQKVDASTFLNIEQDSVENEYGLHIIEPSLIAPPPTPSFNLVDVLQKKKDNAYLRDGMRRRYATIDSSAIRYTIKAY